MLTYIYDLCGNKCNNYEVMKVQKQDTCFKIGEGCLNPLATATMPIN